MHVNVPIANKEVELKLQLPARSLSKLRNNPLLRALKGTPTSTTEVSVYFDTDKRKLYKRKVMLRVRRIGDRYVNAASRSMLRGSDPYDLAHQQGRLVCRASRDTKDPG